MLSSDPTPNSLRKVDGDALVTRCCTTTVTAGLSAPSGDDSLTRGRRGATLLLLLGQLDGSVVGPRRAAAVLMKRIETELKRLITSQQHIRFINIKCNPRCLTKMKSKIKTKKNNFQLKCCSPLNPPPPPKGAQTITHPHHRNSR